jgi:hypothetical protein
MKYQCEKQALQDAGPRPTKVNVSVNSPGAIDPYDYEFTRQRLYFLCMESATANQASGQ